MKDVLHGDGNQCLSHAEYKTKITVDLAESEGMLAESLPEVCMGDPLVGISVSPCTGAEVTYNHGQVWQFS